MLGYVSSVIMVVSIALASTAIGTQMARAAGGGDESFAMVASRVPQFGGAFADEAGGVLYVWLTDPREEVLERAKTALADVLGHEFVEGKVVALRARYSFPELQAWHDAMVDVLSLPGVVFTDIDERENRLRVGVEDREKYGAQVREELTRLEIPRDAVGIDEHAPIAQIPPLSRPPWRLAAAGATLVALILSGTFVAMKLVRRRGTEEDSAAKTPQSGV